MGITQQRNLLWSFLVLATGVLMLLLALNVLPAALADLIERAWPLLFVIAGLNMLLFDRIRFGNGLAVVLSLLLLGGMIVFAYSVQENKVRTAYEERIEPIPLGEHIQGVDVQIEMETTTLSIRPIDGNLRGLAATFRGSEESLVTMSAQENAEGLVNFVIQEQPRNQIPMLSKIGRGHLDVLLPVGTPITRLNVNNARGGIRLDLRDVEAPRFEIQNGFGNLDVYLPSDGISIGDIRIEEGNLRLIIEPTASLRIEDAPADRRLNPNDYVSDQRVIESRGGLQQFQYNLRVAIPNGALVIVPPSEVEEGN